VISPHADETQKWLGEWLQVRGPGLDAAGRRKVDRVGFARYAARLYPDAAPGRLRALGSLFTWFFMVDDTADDTVAMDPGRLRGLLNGALGVLRHNVMPDREHGWPLHRLLADAWRTPRATMPSSWHDRFVDTVAHHMSGLLVEAEARAVGQQPSVTEYVRLRRATSAAYVAHTLTEFATGAPLPDAVHGHPAIRAYSTAGNDLLSWFNDLISLDRDADTAGGRNGHNLVRALAAERELSTVDAIDAAATIWQDRMDGLAGLRAAVPSFGSALDVSVRHFLDGVDRSVRGTIDWSLETARYTASPLVTAYLPGG
jgi:hypothetical protein